MAEAFAIFPGAFRSRRFSRPQRLTPALDLLLCRAAADHGVHHLLPGLCVSPTCDLRVVATISCKSLMLVHPTRRWRLVMPTLRSFSLSHSPQCVTASGLPSRRCSPSFLLPLSQTAPAFLMSSPDLRAFIHERVRLFCVYRSSCRSAMLPWASCSGFLMSLRLLDRGLPLPARCGDGIHSHQNPPLSPRRSRSSECPFRSSLLLAKTLSRSVATVPPRKRGDS